MKRHPARPRQPFAAAAILATASVTTLVAIAVAPHAARAATTCTSASCATTCTPAAPVAISTLVAPSDFPSGHNRPVAFVDPGDGRGRRFVATQQGSILLWDGIAGEMLSTPFLDLRDDVGGPVLYDGSERGLLALALDPEYPVNGRLYVFYTRSDGDIVIARYTRSSADPDVGDAASALTILRLEHSSASNHNGGWLAFGPNDGFLYISTGDGGGGCDGGLGLDGDGQRTDTLHGKLLRIDVRGVDPDGGSPDCPAGTGNYTVPSSNPYFEDAEACDEVWALGLRNPFRFSFDRVTGDLYLGDVGQNKWEEINIQAASTPAPVNWGWPCREGSETADNDESNCDIPSCPVDPGTTSQFPRPLELGGFWDPPLCHYNGGWDSIMGGYRYRGQHVPSLAGAYLYGDAACGQIWKTDTLDPSNQAAVVSSCWASGYQGTFGFAEDHLGELYVVVGGASRIDCIHNGDGCSWASDGFLDGFESGDTSSWSEAAPPE